MPSDEEMTQMSVRIPAAQHERLRAIADERMVGVGLIVTRAIDVFLADLPSVNATLAPTNATPSAPHDGLD
jgi:hypothetical protein